MARPVTTLVVFFVAFNLFAGVVVGVGIDSMLGIDATVDDPAFDEQADMSQDEVPTGTGSGESLLGLYNVLGGFVGSIYETLLPGLNLLERAGVPSFITTGILAPLFSILTVIALASYLRGYDL